MSFYRDEEHREMKVGRENKEALLPESSGPECHPSTQALRAQCRRPLSLAQLPGPEQCGLYIQSDAFAFSRGEA